VHYINCSTTEFKYQAICIHGFKIHNNDLIFSPRSRIITVKNKQETFFTAIIACVEVFRFPVAAGYVFTLRNWLDCTFNSVYKVWEFKIFFWLLLETYCSQYICQFTLISAHTASLATLLSLNTRSSDTSQYQQNKFQVPEKAVLIQQSLHWIFQQVCVIL